MFEQLERLKAAVDTACAVDPDQVADPALLGDGLQRVDRQIRRLQGLRLRLTRAHDRRGGWKADGARSAKQWQRDRCRLTPGQAAVTCALCARRSPTWSTAQTLRSSPTGERLAFQRRAVNLGRRGDGGVWINGRLDVLGGEALLSALSAPHGERDDRSGEQHRAETARQLACDADIHRIITGPGSEVLDLGRSQRTVSVAQRRALTARDRGCIGCSAPPAWTDAHHIRHWSQGGPTDLQNLVLLCRACHTSVHHRGWKIGRKPDGRHTVTRPPRTRPEASRLRATPRDGCQRAS